jgi:hypothetical protein
MHSYEQLPQAAFLLLLKEEGRRRSFEFSGVLSFEF